MNNWPGCNLFTVYLIEYGYESHACVLDQSNGLDKLTCEFSRTEFPGVYSSCTQAKRKLYPREVGRPGFEL